MEVRLIKGYKWANIDEFNTVNNLVKQETGTEGLSYVQNMDENGNVLFLYCGAGGCSIDVMGEPQDFEINLKTEIC